MPSALFSWGHLVVVFIYCCNSCISQRRVFGHKKIVSVFGPDFSRLVKDCPSMQWLVEELGRAECSLFKVKLKGRIRPDVLVPWHVTKAADNQATLTGGYLTNKYILSWLLKCWSLKTILKVASYCAHNNLKSDF